MEPEFPTPLLFMREKLNLSYMTEEAGFNMLFFEHGVKIL
jgi:hypothetical protein